MLLLILNGMFLLSSVMGWGCETPGVAIWHTALIQIGSELGQFLVRHGFTLNTSLLGLTSSSAPQDALASANASVALAS